jgi:aromatic ring-opening dioxygenase catalytic subunit (LigB family)
MPTEHVAMVLQLVNGKLILTPMELLCKLEGGVQLRALCEDIRLLDSPRLLIADAGAVSWTLPLDTDEQLALIRDFYGLPKE